MSVVVFDGTSLAADSMANGSMSSVPFPKLTKLSQTGGSTMVAGVIGPTLAATQLLRWAEAGLVPEQFPSKEVFGSGAQLLVVSKEKGVEKYSETAIPTLHGLNKFAIGEGAPFAYGAMFAGADAVKAVEAAIHYSPHCNGSPEVLHL